MGTEESIYFPYHTIILTHSPQLSGPVFENLGVLRKYNIQTTLNPVLQVHFLIRPVLSFINYHSQLLIKIVLFVPIMIVPRETASAIIKASFISFLDWLLSRFSLFRFVVIGFTKTTSIS